MTNPRLPDILLFSMPRSGSTWIGKILDSHPRTIYSHEPDTAYRLTDVPAILDGNTNTRESKDLCEFIERVSSIKTTRTCGKTPIFSKTYLPLPRLIILKSSIYLTKILEKFSISTSISTPYKFKQTEVYPLVWKSIISLGRLSSIQSL